MNRVQFYMSLEHHGSEQDFIMHLTRQTGLSPAGVHAQEKTALSPGSVSTFCVFASKTAPERFCVQTVIGRQKFMVS